MEPRSSSRRLLLFTYSLPLSFFSWAVQDLLERVHTDVAVTFFRGACARVIEAKPWGTTLSGVAGQSEKYLRLIPDSFRVVEPPPFAYESTGFETFFRDSRGPEPPKP